VDTSKPESAIQIRGCNNRKQPEETAESKSQSSRYQNSRKESRPADGKVKSVNQATRLQRVEPDSSKTPRGRGHGTSRTAACLGKSTEGGGGQSDRSTLGESETKEAGWQLTGSPRPEKREGGGGVGGGGWGGEGLDV